MRKQRVSSMVVMVAVLLLLTPSVAQAHYVYALKTTWKESPNITVGDHCLQVRSETSHGPGGGYWKVNVYAFRDLSATTDGCPGPDLWNRSANQLAVKITIMKCRAPCDTADDWYECVNRGWVYNKSTAPTLSDSVSTNVPPCGSGYYGGYGFGTTVLNGSWLPAPGVWSGSHYLPA
jgi:hypothetical protein